MKVSIGEHFTFKKILQLTAAPVFMMVFVSLYTVVDGICVANLAGNNSFAAVNLVYPITAVIGGVGMMFSAGGAALTSKFLGQKNRDKANQTFTNVFIFCLIIAAVLSLVGFFVVDPYVDAMAKISKTVTDDTIYEAKMYGKIIMGGQFFFIAQSFYQSYFIVDGKQLTGFFVAIAAGVTNIVLDLVFIGICKMGATGAAVGTVLGYVVGSTTPTIYFLTHKNGVITYVKPEFDLKLVGRSALNGINDYINYAATTVTGVVFNTQLLKYYGQVGVEAYGIVMYVILIFWGVFIGYSISMAPVAGYCYGAKNNKELTNVKNKSLIIVTCLSLFMLALGEGLATPLSKLFNVNLGEPAMRIWSISFLFCGFSFYISSFFVGLNNGVMSGIISVSRNIALLVLFVEVLPLGLGEIGIWWASPFCEFTTMLIAFIILYANQDKYKY